jgi:hypothetical protein
MIDAEDQIRAHVLKNPHVFGKDETDTILALYPDKAKFSALLRQDAERFAEAVKQTGAPVGTTDPIVALASRYEWELDLKLVAAEVGAEKEDFLRRLDGAPDMVRLFGLLRTEGGTVPRQLVEEKFGDLVRDLRLGDPVPSGGLVNSIGMRLVEVPAAKGILPFRMGAHEVTQEEYEAVTGKNPSHFSAAGRGRDRVKGMDTSRFPVENVSWEEAVQFCEELTRKEKGQGRKYRLPTAAEWEHACRADGKEPPELDQHGWYEANSQGRTHPVGQKLPNAWGLYDMHGNVLEWCADPSTIGKRVFPTMRLQRGGSWEHHAEKCQSDSPHHGLKIMGHPTHGFRVVLEMGEKTR